MIRSMTAYATGIVHLQDLLLVVEISSFNRKNLDIHTHFPKELSFLEIPTRKKIASYSKRGAITIRLIPGRSSDIAHFFPKESILKNVHNFWEEQQKKLKLSGQLGIEFIAYQAEKCLATQKEDYSEKEVDTFFGELEKILHGWVQMKQEEGKALAGDLLPRVQTILVHLEKIEKISHLSIHRYEEKLKEKIKKISEEASLDKERLAKEVVLFADRIDITEEIVRLRSHLNQFEKKLQDNEEISIGKTLEFLVQEMLREANSMGVKSQELEIAKLVLEIKGEIEKLREQVMNIE